MRCPPLRRPSLLLMSPGILFYQFTKSLPMPIKQQRALAPNSAASPLANPFWRPKTVQNSADDRLGGLTLKPLTVHDYSAGEWRVSGAEARFSAAVRGNGGVGAGTRSFVGNTYPRDCQPAGAWLHCRCMTL